MSERGLLEKIAEISGENPYICVQCGKCTASCPMIDDVDQPPRRIIQYLLAGKEDLLELSTVWLCASCFMCTARCPKGLDLAKIMDALRQTVLRKGADRVDVRSIPSEELAGLPQIAMVSNFRKLTG